MTIAVVARYASGDTRIIEAPTHGEFRKKLEDAFKTRPKPVSINKLREINPRKD